MAHNCTIEGLGQLPPAFAAMADFPLDDAGLVTMCAAGGMAPAIIIERI